MKTKGYIELLKSKTGIKSDYGIAKHLKLTRSAISRYQSGDGFFSDEVAVKVAVQLDLDAGIVLADIHAEREKDPVLHKAWLQIARSLQQATAAAFVLVMLGIPTHSAEASTLNASYSSCLSVYTLYELKKMLKNAFLLRLCSFLRNISLAHFLLNRSFCTEWETIECH